MSNNKDFKVKNGVKPTVYHEAVGTVVSESVGYNIAGASYDSVSLSLSSQDSQPRSLTLNNNGTKMYVIGSSGDRVYQYSLSTAFDLGTASYDNISFSIASQETVPFGFIFKPDGTKMYVVGDSDGVYQYSLSTAFDLSTASYDGVSFNVSGQTANPFDIVFNNNGTKMYLIGYSESSVYQYSLSTAYNLSTASYDSISSSVNDSPRGLSFNGDGTKMFILSSANVYQYSLPSAYDVSAPAYDNISFSLSGQDFVPECLVFNNDGSKLYTTGFLSVAAYQYSTTQNTASLDLSTGSVFEITPTSDIQVTLSNPAASGTVSGATLLLEAVGTAYTITYDIAIQWSAGTAPTAPAIGDTDVITFSTRDGGTTYSAALAIDGAA